MMLHGLKEQVKRDQRQAPGIWFRLVYYAAMFLISGILIGILYLGSLLE